MNVKRNKNNYGNTNYFNNANFSGVCFTKPFRFVHPNGYFNGWCFNVL